MNFRIVDQPDSTAELAENTSLQLSKIDRTLGREKDRHLVAVRVELSVRDAQRQLQILRNLLNSLGRVLFVRVVRFDRGDLGEVGVAQNVRGDVERRGGGRDGANPANVLAAVGLHDHPVALRDEEHALEGAELVLKGDDGEARAGGIAVVAAAASCAFSGFLAVVRVFLLEVVVVEVVEVGVFVIDVVGRVTSFGAASAAAAVGELVVRNRRDGRR